MTDFEKIKIIARHIDLVRKNCWSLATKLLNENPELSVELMKNAYKHDLSKFSNKEFEHLWEESPFFQETLNVHRKENKHHPESWVSLDKTKSPIQNMRDVYLAEMVCDCFARGQEFGTDVREWFATKATVKYGFIMNDEVGQKITKYLNLLLIPKFH